MKGINAPEASPQRPNIPSKPRVLSTSERNALPDTQRTREAVADLSAMLTRQEKRRQPNAISVPKQEIQPRRSFVQKIGEFVARSAERDAQRKVYERFLELKDKVAFGLIDSTNQTATLALLKKGAGSFDENSNNSTQNHKDQDPFLVKTKQLNDQIISEHPDVFAQLLLHGNPEVSGLAAETLGVFMRTTKLDTAQTQAVVVQSYRQAHENIDNVVRHIADPSQQQSAEVYLPLIGLAAQYGDADTRRRAAQVLLILHNQKDLPYFGKIHTVIGEVAQHVQQDAQVSSGNATSLPPHTEPTPSPSSVVQTLANT